MKSKNDKILSAKASLDNGTFSQANVSLLSRVMMLASFLTESGAGLPSAAVDGRWRCVFANADERQSRFKHTGHQLRRRYAAFVMRLSLEVNPEERCCCDVGAVARIKARGMRKPLCFLVRGCYHSIA